MGSVGGSIQAMITQSRRPVLLLTRPKAQSERFAAQLAPSVRDAVDIVIAPLMEINMSYAGDLQSYEGVVLTSENAARALSLSSMARMPAFCVGPRTAKVAQTAGFDTHVFGRDADQLVNGVAKMAPKGPLLHLHGTHTRVDVAGRLTALGIPTEARVVYNQVSCSWPDKVINRMRNADRVIAPLFSPRTACLFVAECPEDLRAEVICLSEAVAGELSISHRLGCVICASPTGANMAQAIFRVVMGEPLEGL